VAGGVEGVFDFADAQGAEVKHARGQDRVRAGIDGGCEVRQRPGAAARDHRDGDHVAHGPDQLEVEADRGAVRVHRVQQDLARAELGGLARPADRVDAGADPAAVRGHLEAARCGRRAPCVHREHHALGPESLGRLGQQFGPGDGGGVQRDLVRPGSQQPVHVSHAAHASAHGQRDKYLLGGTPHHVVHRVPAAARGGDIEKGQLVGAFGVIEGGQLHRVSRVPQLAEVHPFDHPAAVHIQAGDNPDRDRHLPTSARASSRVNAPS
jgi:hypothetical protein